MKSAFSASGQWFPTSQPEAALAIASTIVHDAPRVSISRVRGAASGEMYRVIRKIIRRGVDRMKAIAVQRVINRRQSTTRLRRNDSYRPGRERRRENTLSAGYHNGPVPIWHSKVPCSCFITRATLGVGKLARFFQDMSVQDFLHVYINFGFSCTLV